MFRKCILCIFMTCAVFTGCNSQKNDTVELGRFQHASGAYEYSDISFDSTKEDLKKSFGLDPGQPDYSTDEAETYRVVDQFQYSGQPLSLSLEFKGEQLDSVMFSFPVEAGDAEKTFSEIHDSFVSEYGPATGSTEYAPNTPELDLSQGDAKLARWDSAVNGEATSLQLLLSTFHNAKPYIHFGVLRLPETP